MKERNSRQQRIKEQSEEEFKYENPDDFEWFNPSTPTAHCTTCARLTAVITLDEMDW
jgi:hypothetical protein